MSCPISLGISIDGQGVSVPDHAAFGEGQLRFGDTAPSDARPNSLCFAFDEAHNGSSYAVGPMALEGLPQLWARLVGVSYLRQGDRHGFALSFEADPRLSELYFQIGEEAVSETGKSLSSIRFSREAQSGLLVVPIMTEADLAMPLTLIVPSFQIQGDWTLEWIPPAASESSEP